MTDPGVDTVTSRVVNWGDGISETVPAGAVVNHTYATSGTKNIVVDLVNEDGLHLGAGRATVTVGVVAPTRADRSDRGRHVAERDPVDLDEHGGGSDVGADRTLQGRRLHVVLPSRHGVGVGDDVPQHGTVVTHLVHLSGPRGEQRRRLALVDRRRCDHAAELTHGATGRSRRGAICRTAVR